MHMCASLRKHHMDVILPSCNTMRCNDISAMCCNNTHIYNVPMESISKTTGMLCHTDRRNDLYYYTGLLHM